MQFDEKITTLKKNFSTKRYEAKAQGYCFL